MKRAAATLALLVGLAGPASALPQANNWIVGEWSCRLGQRDAAMRWQYPLVACADDCSGGDPAAARPEGTLRVGGGPLIRLQYASGDATQFSYRHQEGLVVRMTRISSSPYVMQGAYPAGEVSIGLRCTKSSSPQFERVF